MKLGARAGGCDVSFVGYDGDIGEVVVFANHKENGFAVVRVLGKDMNPTGIMTIISVLKTSNIDLKQLKPLQDMFKNNFKG